MVQKFFIGVHAEGTLWHTLLGLLFYDIIFDPNIENVWFSETQVCLFFPTFLLVFIIDDILWRNWEVSLYKQFLPRKRFV